MDELKVDELKVQWINNLETLVSEYKSTLASLPSPSTAPRSSPSKPTQPSPSLLTELEQKLFELSGEIAGGRHVPPKTRVLQLVDNLEQQWLDLPQSTMDKLREENSALL